MTVALVGRRRLAPALLAAAGVGWTTLDVAGRTLLQRVARPEALARVFGLLEGVSMASLAVGSVLAAASVALAGERGAFVCLAVVLPLAAAVVARGLLAADAATLPVVELARLRALPMFSLLGAPDLEALARAVEPVAVPAGGVVVTEGEPGDRFYVVADGEVEVVRGGTSLGRLGRGDCFGEIALLREVPRSATVRAVTDVRLDALDKASFLRAVTGSVSTARLADELASARLEHAAVVR